MPASRRDDRGYYTLFWGTTRHDWPRDALTEAVGFPVATAEALESYASAHERRATTEPASS